MWLLIKNGPYHEDICFRASCLPLAKWVELISDRSETTTGCRLEAITVAGIRESNPAHVGHENKRRPHSHAALSKLASKVQVRHQHCPLSTLCLLKAYLVPKFPLMDGPESDYEHDLCKAHMGALQKACLHLPGRVRDLWGNFSSSTHPRHGVPNALPIQCSHSWCCE